MSGAGAPPAAPRLAVYVPHYLTISMTFVHRQLTGVGGDFEASVLTTSAANLERFPLRRVHVRPPGALDRLARAARRISGSTRGLGPGQERGFERDLRAIRPALVHAHFGPGGMDVLPVVRRLGIPLVVTFHGYDASSLLRDPAYVRELRALLGYAHAVAISRLVAERLRGRGARDGALDVHHIGVPLGRFPFVARRPVAEKIRAGEPLSFLQVANFVEKKGHAVTVEAFARYARAGTRWSLTLAGDGPLRRGIEDQVRRAGLADRVAFPGALGEREVAGLMAGSDVFVHHSVTGPDGNEEGIPTVVMEAMASGLVVVSTRHAGIPELVEEGREGYLVGERDVEAYAEALCGLADADPDLPRRARAKVEREFDIERQNRALVGIYRRAIAAGPGR